MLVHVSQVLTPQEVQRCRDVMQRIDWVDGRATAGHQAAQVKHNLQLPQTRGSRIASFFWTESMIADVTKRGMMFDLDMSIIRLTADHPEHPSVVSLPSLYHNLLRQWARSEGAALTLTGLMLSPAWPAEPG